MQRPYTALAALLNCRTDEIAILTSATAAWQQVMLAGWRPFRQKGLQLNLICEGRNSCCVRSRPCPTRQPRYVTARAPDALEATRCVNWEVVLLQTMPAPPRVL